VKDSSINSIRKGAPVLGFDVVEVQPGIEPKDGWNILAEWGTRWFWDSKNCE
jgi:hypothetical protein